MTWNRCNAGACALAPQAWQRGEPRTGAKVLGGHAEHFCCPLVEKWPTGHGSHAAVGPMLKYPAAQLLQLLAPPLSTLCTVMSVIFTLPSKNFGRLAEPFPGLPPSGP